MNPNPITDIMTDETTSETRHPQPITPPVQKTIVSKLKKFFGGSNKPQTVATEIPAQGGNGGGGAFILYINGETGALTKTWKEINDAWLGGKNVILNYGSGAQSGMLSMSADDDPRDGGYRVYFDGFNRVVYRADSENGYPSRE